MSTINCIKCAALPARASLWSAWTRLSLGGTLVSDYVVDSCGQVGDVTGVDACHRDASVGQ